MVISSVMDAVWRRGARRGLGAVLGFGFVLALADGSELWAGFTVEGRELRRDGVPFQVKGVCYQPTPIGSDASAAPPYGDYFTGAYATITARDLPNLRAMGANAVRVYGWDPAADHSAFLDACYNGGANPIHVIVNRWIDPNTAWTNAAAVGVIEQDFLQIDQRLGAHPAVLAIVLGNEANAQNGNGANAAYWESMNRIATAIKAQTPGRLVSVAITDAVPQIAANNSRVPALDFWCVQTYRGTTLGSLFTEYVASSTKPLLLTEFGLDAYNQTAGASYADNAAQVATVVGGLWDEIAANAATCMGACVFEYSDEWWKSAGRSASAHDTGGFALGGLPDGFANEEWWGLYAVADNGVQPDVLTPRATVAALQERWVTAQPAVPLAVRVPPVSQTVAPGGTAQFEVAVTAATEPVLTYQWFKDEAALAGAVSAELSLTGLTTADSGWYTVQVTQGTETVTSERARLLVATPEPGRLKNLSVRSRSGTGVGALVVGFVVADGSAQVLVRAVGPGLAQFGVTGISPDPQLEVFANGEATAFNEDWAVGGAAVEIAAAAGQVGAFAIEDGSKDAAVLATFDGPRSVQVRDVQPGIVLAEAYEVTTGPGRLSNVSARSWAGAGDGVLVVGFVIDGNVPKRMLVRGIGPGLEAFGVTRVVANPQIRVFDSNQQSVTSNDDWDAELVATSAASVGAFDLTAGSADAAVLTTLVPGAYSAQVSGVDGGTGVALDEVYEVP